MTIKPLGDRIVAKKEQPKEKTASGILLGEAKETPAYSVVESVGPDVKSVKKGDKVLLKEYSSTDIKFENTDYIIAEEKDILAIVE